MEHGLRRYEAFQGLFMIFFLIVCLFLAYPMATLYGYSYSPDSPISFTGANFRTVSFWMQQQWIDKGPFGGAIVFLGWFSFIFVIARFVWLPLQVLGRYMAGDILDEATSRAPRHNRPSLETLMLKPEQLFDAEHVRRKADQFPHKFVLHPFQRLLLLLPQPKAAMSSEELAEKERRVSETDWQFLHNSWSPVKWLLWILPLLALMQTVWLSFEVAQHIIPKGAENPELLSAGPVLECLLPILQIVAFSIFLNLGCGLQRRMESIYLSGVDALFYDKLLSRLPFRSGDTPVILEALQRLSEEILSTLERMEKAPAPQGKPSSE